MYVSSGTDPGRIIRIVAIFVAGVVVAVGAALVYSMAKGSAHAVNQPPEDKAAGQPAQAEEAANAPDQNVPAVTVTEREPKPRTARPAATKSQPEMPDTPQANSSIGRSSVDQVGAGVPRTSTIASTSPAATTPEPLAAALPGPDVEPPPVARPPAQAGQQAPRVQRSRHVVTLGPGSGLTIRLSETVSTAQDFAGRRFRASLETPVVANGFVIADRGSAAVGRLLYVRRGGLLGKKPELSLILTGINTTDGQFVYVQTAQWDEKGARGGLTLAARRAFSDVANVVSDAGKVAGFRSERDETSTQNRRGRDLVLARGSTLTFRLSAPVTITERTREGR